MSKTKMNSLTLNAPAKINLHLAVGELNDSGRHDVATVIAKLSLHDTLTFTSIDEETCEITGFGPELPPEENLIYGAWEAMRDEYPEKVKGLRVEVEKRIPSGAGLGGGSSDAAATVNAIHRLCNLGMSEMERARVGSYLGADVPPLILSSPLAECYSDGSEAHPAGKIPLMHFVLLEGPAPMPTAEAYRLLDQARPVADDLYTLEGVLGSLRSSNPEERVDTLYNDFELIGKSIPGYDKAVQELMAAGCITTLLCGSGSTVAGLARDGLSAQKISQRIGGTWAYTL